MEIRILGSVEVCAHGRSGLAGPPQQQAVLAALAVDAGRSVPLDVLLDRVWGEAAPARARRTLHAHITRIRRLLECVAEGEDQPARIVNKAGGYLLDVDPIRVDLHRFRDLRNRANEPQCPDEQSLLLLRAALDLWRGSPLAGVPGPWAVRSRQWLRQEHLDTVVAWAEAELRSGSPAAVVTVVTALLDEHPLVESLTAVLMRALHATGRTARALEHYLSTRNRFIEELGVEPGPELQRLHKTLLCGGLDQPPPSPPPPSPPSPAAQSAVPKQLPMDVPGFTGRTEELAQLDALLTGTESAAVVISAVLGTAGVGKTALAIHWAHRVAERFPDGQLYVNLRGYDPDQPLTAGDALARFLTALGVPSADLPFEVDERAGRYRTELAGRRILVVLDNAATTEQVYPLLPGTASCAVVVTSRDALAGLVAVHGAHRIDLDLLPPADALALLRRLVGTRVDAEADAAAVLAEQCARLPLGLRVAAELAISRPTAALADLVTELADQRRRLDLLNAGGDPRAAVAAVFSWSVRHLPSAAATAFGLLGLHPGADFDAYAAAALTGAGLDHARHTLDVLARAHLVHPTAHGRYGMHDLLRAYAAELSTSRTTVDDRRTALTRLFDYYLAVAAAATDTLYPAEAHYRPRIPPPATPVPAVVTTEAARCWLDTERSNLTAITVHTSTSAHNWPTHAVRLSTILFRYLYGGHHTDALTIHAHAHHAAEQDGDHAGQAHTLFSLGATHQQLGHYELAAEHLQQALARFRQAGDQSWQARALNGLCLVEWRLGRYGPAATHVQNALALFRQAGDEAGEAAALNHLGIVEQLQGHYRAAADCYEQALAMHRQSGDRDGEALALNSLGLVEQQLGQHGPAVEHHKQALSLFYALGNRVGEAHALDNLGAAHTRLDQPEHAIRYFQRALTLFLEVGDRDGESWVLNGLGEAARAARRPADAITHHTAALTVATRIGARDQQARAHAGLGHAHRSLGHSDLARTHYAQALAQYTELGVPEAEAVRRHLADLDDRPLRQRDQSPAVEPVEVDGPSGGVHADQPAGEAAADLGGEVPAVHLGQDR